MVATAFAPDPLGLVMWQSPLLVGILNSPQLDESIFSRALRDHCMHTTFLIRDAPQKLGKGFCCSCSGKMQTWMVPITQLKMMHKSVSTLLSALKVREDTPGLLWHANKSNQFPMIEITVAQMESLRKRIKKIDDKLLRRRSPEQRKKLRAQRKRFQQFLEQNRDLI